MNWFNNLKIGSKLLVAVLLLCVNASLMGAVGMKQMEATRSGKLLEELVPNIRKTADLVQEVSAALPDEDRESKRF
ncbi:hypothetical protein KYC5002_03270 [Archangium violaceum]|uniref:hypothetical protein n=1 Tax=Archangium violaceum TaxID=83451 RepID=UPI002B314B9F|nr:hypothetical protein KYC5002_03270 [Archangium gephyra]